MLKIIVKKAGSLDKALKELKRKISKIGIIEELRDRQSFTKKSVRQRNNIKKAEYRQRMKEKEQK